MLISFLRTLLLYIVLVLTVRLMGKRQIGEMEPSEFVVTMLIANLAAIPMQDTAIPLLSGLVPILVILGVELILAVHSDTQLFLRETRSSDEKREDHREKPAKNARQSR